MTSNIERRINQVRTKWEIPDAYILATITVSGRARALGVEHMLHWDWHHRRAYDYPGIEFFRFTNEDLNRVLVYFGEDPIPLPEIPVPEPDPEPLPEPEPEPLPEPEPEPEDTSPEFVLEDSKRPLRLFFKRAFSIFS